jgi:hypothetical protein
MYLLYGSAATLQTAVGHQAEYSHVTSWPGG